MENSIQIMQIIPAIGWWALFGKFRKGEGHSVEFFQPVAAWGLTNNLGEVVGMVENGELCPIWDLPLAEGIEFFKYIYESELSNPEVLKQFVLFSKTGMPPFELLGG